MEMRSVLSIAGSDPSGGAGVQADIKTIAAHRLFAQTAITTLTIQNTTGVYGVVPVSPEDIERQIDVVFDDIRPDAVKIGVVPSPEAAAAIARALVRAQAANVVVDPVMVATSGSALADSGVARALVEHLFPLATVVTPNIPESEALVVLVGRSEKRGGDGAGAGEAAASAPAIVDKAGMERAARIIGSATPGAVLVKGGHSVEDADDCLRLSDGSVLWLEGRRIDTPNTHGTGCTLSSAIACGLAEGLSVREAVARAKAYLSGALASGLDLGKGSGPVDHMWRYAEGAR